MVTKKKLITMNNILFKMIEHMVISLSALSIGVVIALPIGILISSNKKASTIIIAICSILQTIPSLALLAIMVPIVGVGKVPAIIALSLYSLLPILHNTVLGMHGVDFDTIDAAKGMGMSFKQILIAVKLPLAAPMILAGIRLSLTYVIVWATIASFVGAGGMGDLIFAGLNNYDINLLVISTIAITFLTIITDLIFAKVSKFFEPKFGENI